MNAHRRSSTPTRRAIASLLALLGCTPIACGQESSAANGKDPAMAKAATTPRYSKSGYDITPLDKSAITELAKKLTPEQWNVTQDAGTERAFCGGLLQNKEHGIYVCVVCGLPLFRSDAKFESGTGWPSFFQPFDPDHVTQIRDDSLGMERIEIRCARSGSHLGHVFDDGPKPTGLRFCLNSAALTFIKDGDPLPPESRPVESQSAYFAGGCFWGVEDLFEQIPGVIDAASGYMGGKVSSPTYEMVCGHDTGHAETVKVVFDPKRVTYRDLLDVFFKNHDPTTLNRQGPDVGDNYRSAIFCTDAAQKEQADAFIAELTKAGAFRRPIVTQVVLGGGTFWPAEEYHQDYHKKHGGSCRVVR